MSNNSGTGGCLSTLLFIMIVGAIFGLVSWDTVGSFIQVIIVLSVISVVIFGILMLWSRFND